MGRVEAELGAQVQTAVFEGCSLFELRPGAVSSLRTRADFIGLSAFLASPYCVNLRRNVATSAVKARIGSGRLVRAVEATLGLQKCHHRSLAFLLEASRLSPARYSGRA